VLTKQGKNQEALNMLTDALRKEPHDPAILRHRANVLWTLGQFRDALADLKAGADTGDAASEHELGQWYWNGVPGVLDPDRSAAMAWLRKSAAQGFAPAKVDLQAFSTVYEGPTK
jgi:TPR repeat protein